MRRALALFISWVLLSGSIFAQSILPGFPPGRLLSRGAIDTASAPPSYSGPGDVLSGASAYWSLRGYNAAFSGSVANICDAATGLVCLDATWSSGTLTVPQIGGVTCDNVTTICQVKTLYDQSGALACAGSTACDFTQATAAKRPTLIMPGAANGCPTTAFPCISFVFASAQCLTSTAAYTQALPISGAFVGVRTGNTTTSQYAITLHVVAVNPVAMGWSTDNLVRITAGTSRTLAATDSVWHAVQGVWSNSVGQLNVDGTNSTANNGTNPVSAQTMVMGGGGTTCSQPGDIKLVEVVLYPVDFASSIAALNTNQRSYWGF